MFIYGSIQNLSRDDVKRTREIFNHLWPLPPWRGEKASVPKAKESVNATSEKDLRDVLALRASPLDLDYKRVEWVPAEDTERVRAAFVRLRDLFYNWNQKSKPLPGKPPRLMWESGNITGHRPYFFLQPWSEMGYLFEMTQRGWVVSRAEKIINLDRFMRQLSAWDHVVLYESREMPDTLRIRSEHWGEDFVSLPLYEDAMIRLFRELFPSESQAKRRIDF
jgi:hypothetical protein